MQIIDVYTKKEYDCHKCGEKVYYAKIADDTGKLVTTDGKEPNGKYGKDSNVLSGAVDVNVKDRLHRCTLGATEDKYWSLVKQKADITQELNGTRKQIAKSPNEPNTVRWPVIPEQLTDTMSELYHAYQQVNTIAYMLTKEQHPDEREDSNLFGQIANAKATILSNLFLAQAIKKSKTN